MATQDIGTMRTNLLTALDTISTLANHKQEPDALPKVPFTILGNAEIDFDADMDDGRVAVFRLFLASGNRDASTAFADLDNYIASTGSKSIKTAIEAGSAGDYSRVMRVENIGFVVYRGKTFVGAEFIIEVLSGG